MFKKYKAHFVLGLLVVCAIVTFAIAGTISQQPYGISTPYWYGYSSGAPASYYLAAPTLSANDTAVGLAATQTLTNKTLTSPTITGPTLSGTVTGGTFASSTLTAPTLNAPIVDLSVTAKTGNYTVTASDAGQVLTNNGATGEITFTLPEASTVVGQRFNFVVVSAYTVNVDVDDADIIVPDTDSAGNKIIAPGTLGQMIGLLALDNTNYVHILGTQSWPDGD